MLLGAETNANFWFALLILFGVALLCCSCGYKKFVCFLSVGYGFAIFGIGVTILIFGLTRAFGIEGMSPQTIVLSCLLMAYGLRLSGFLLFREIKSASYRQTLKKVAGKEEKKMPFPVKFAIWISVGILYVMETAPVYYRLGVPSNAATGYLVPMIGAGVALLGLVMETAADLQKSAAKKKDPHRFVSTGLYKFVRYPNYFGEILFWTGIFVSGCDIFETDWVAWLLSILGYLLIVYVMLSGAKRLEKRQNKNYGSLPEYQEYVRKTPMLCHLIPIKTMQGWNWVK